MRLLLDANISFRILGPLQALGHEVISMVQEAANASDETVLQRAFNEGRTVITYDKDFGELVFQKGQQHSGVILLRTHQESYPAQLEVLKEFLQHYSELEIQGHFWVITEASIRKTRI